MCTNTLYNTIRMTTTQDPTYPLKPNYAQYAKDKFNHAQYHKAQAHSFKVFAFNYLTANHALTITATTPLPIMSAPII